MSDELDIRRGGVIAVDTESLRAAAGGLDRWGDDLRVAAGRIRWAAGHLRRADHAVNGGRGAADLAERAESASRRAGALAADVRGAADIYELVELGAARAAAQAAGDESAASLVLAAMVAIVSRRPWAGLAATTQVATAALGGPLDLADQAGRGALPLGPGGHAGAWMFFAGLGWALAAYGQGSVPRDARLTGAPPPVVVKRTAPPHPATPPSTLAAAARLIPGGGDARVRVERYTMANGKRQFAVYIAGTQAGAPEEAFDMPSNIELYGGERSASYEAVRRALRDAGAGPGDVVHAFGHSQGAMIAGRMALEGEFDVQTLVSFGSPIEADAPGSTLSVTVRHTDDPVAALAGYGAPEGTGSDGSFIAERRADPAVGLRDLMVPAHALDAYTETAEMLDASTDPRMGEMRGVLDGLAGAASVDVVEYSAARVVRERVEARSASRTSVAGAG